MGMNEEDLLIRDSVTTREKELLYSLTAVSALFSKSADKYLLSSGLTEAQYHILELLQGADRKGMTQVEISEKLSVNRSNITGLIDRLEKGGFVMRCDDPSDRRINRIKLREKAKKVLSEMQGAYMQFMTRLFKTFSKDEIKTWSFLISKLQKQLEKFP